MYLEQQTQDVFPTVQIKDINAMIDGRNLFHHAIKNDIRTYDNISKFTICQRNDYSGCLLDYLDFRKYCQMIAIDLSKQAQGTDPEAIQQTNFTGNLDVNVTMFFIIETSKETTRDFSQ